MGVDRWNIGVWVAVAVHSQAILARPWRVLNTTCGEDDHDPEHTDGTFRLQKR